MTQTEASLVEKVIPAHEAFKLIRKAITAAEELEIIKKGHNGKIGSQEGYTSRGPEERRGSIDAPNAAEPVGFHENGLGQIEAGAETSAGQTQNY